MQITGPGYVVKLAPGAMVSAPPVRDKQTFNNKSECLSDRKGRYCSGFQRHLKDNINKVNKVQKKSKIQKKNKKS